MKNTIAVVSILISMVLMSCASIKTPIRTEVPYSNTFPPPIPTLNPTITQTKQLWRRTNALVSFNGMAVLSERGIWAVGNNGIIVYDSPIPYWGSDREYMSIGNNVNSSAVSFISPYDGWITTSNGQIFHWEGEKWSNAMPRKLNNSWRDIGFVNKNMGWVVGCYVNRVEIPALMQWNSVSWENVPLPGEIKNGYCLTDIDIAPMGNVWVIGNNGIELKSILLHWNGSEWQEVATPPEMRTGVSVSAVSPTDVWVINGNEVFYWNGSIWKKTELFVNFVVDDIGLAHPAVLALSQDNVWIGGSALYHWNGSEWINTNYEANNISDYIVDIETDSYSHRDIWASTLQGDILQLANDTK